MPFTVRAAGKWIRAALAKPAPPYLIEDLVPWDGLTVLTGPPKDGQKSWLAFTIALAAATGVPYCGVVPRQRCKVWYINREGGELGSAFRLAKLTNGMGVDIDSPEFDESFSITHGGKFDLMDPAHHALTVAIVRKLGIQLVIVDTLARSGVVDENSARDMGQLIEGVMQLRQAGTAVLVVHHTNKATPTKDLVGWPTPLIDVRGSSALVGAADMLLSSRIYETAAHGRQRYLLCTSKEQNPAELGFVYSNIVSTGCASVKDYAGAGELPAGDSRFSLERIAEDHFDPTDNVDEDAEYALTTM